MTTPKELTDIIQDDPYLNVPLLREDVAKKVPQWDTYLGTGAGFINNDELKVIKEIEEEFASKAQGLTSEANSSKTKEYFKVLFALLDNIHSVETLRYIILLVNRLYEENPEHSLQIIVELGTKPIDLLTKLISIEDSDWFIRDEGGKFIGNLLSAHPTLLSNETRTILFKWLCSQISLPVASNPADVRAALKCIMKILFQRSLRKEFYSSNNFKSFVKIAQDCMSTTKFQAVYESFYCIWLLSFEEHVQKHRTENVIEVVINALKLLQKEKITRVSLGILKNYCSEKENMNKMIECQALVIIPQLHSRKTADPEIIADISFLDEILNKQASEMSTWESYRHSVLGKTLDWSPVHKSENFWKENPFHFEDNHNEVLLALKSILLDSNDNKSIAVACYDVGEFVLAHPKGKSLVTKLEIKDALMKHMMSTDAEVKRNAVLAYQKIVLNGWEAAASL